MRIKLLYLDHHFASTLTFVLHYVKGIRPKLLLIIFNFGLSRFPLSTSLATENISFGPVEVVGENVTAVERERQGHSWLKLVEQMSM